jgi:hypothetical protein
VAHAGSEEGAEQTVVIDKSPQPNKEQLEREVADAIRGIAALRKLTKETRFQTGRSQSSILKTLNEEQLAKVAIALAALEEAGR